MTINFYKQNNVWIFRDVLTPPNTLMMKELTNERVLIMDRARRTRYQGRVDNILDADGNPYENFAALYTATEDFFNDFNEPAVIQLGIDLENGSTTKYLSEKGTMEEIPAPMTEVTYDQLAAAITASTLTPGAKYRITDYQTVHTIPNTEDTNTGEVEPLLVTAISANELAPEAYSALFPDDVIYYSPTNDQAMVPGCTKGYIYRRVDTKQNNDIPFDFRQVKFRRWQISQPTWNAATTYAQGAVVKSTSDDSLWVSLQANNLNKATSDTGYWRQFEWQNLSYVSPGVTLWSGTSGFSLALTHTALYQDYKMWANASDYDSAYSNKLEGNSTDLIANSNTVIFWSDFNSNSIGARFSGNSIGARFSGNSIGAGFQDNSIGSDFNSNSIELGFRYNSIESYFYSNSIGSNFSSNSIGAGFRNNSIGAGFQDNSIGSYFYFNSIGAGFQDNSIESYFYSNSIGSNFSSNSIGAGFRNNSIGAGFQDNSIGANFNSNSIGANFSSNSIGSYFYFNSIGSNFSSNSIGPSFSYNTVLPGFSGKDLTSVSELYDKSYPHEIISAASGYVITWYGATGTLQKTYTA